MRISVRLDEEVSVLFPGIPQGSGDELPPLALKLRGRNAGTLRRIFGKPDLNQLELPLTVD
ncbi:hypothetical protein ACUHMQ_18135 [Chitinimonas sp. PSY-7]|uniref:hypothetical protein n=1 Tax=Chitinimonas sp. PSY-7 TaxID=3459088 RepID=UPI0040400AF4